MLSHELIRENLDNDIARQIIESHLGGKLAILSSDGIIRVYGDNWIFDDGMIYSNQSYSDYDKSLFYDYA